MVDVFSVSGTSCAQRAVKAIMGTDRFHQANYNCDHTKFIRLYLNFSSTLAGESILQTGNDYRPLRLRE